MVLSNNEDVRKAILECRASTKRPNADVIRGAMANLVKDALGETA